jgi:L-seryl-tRNA(Ser) seleniumtransferase
MSTIPSEANGSVGSSTRAIPSIDQLAQRSSIRALADQYGHELVIEALRAAAGEMREALRTAVDLPSREDVATAIEERAAVMLDERARPSLRRVINATGVIIHTNLGRAPLSAAARARIDELARGYTNLEYDLVSGQRGARDEHAERLLRQLTGAEAAVVVNNCAAATMLILAVLARGREVVISRAELVEIGGGFRIPDVLAQSGARLREVGTTNRTRVSDYALAISERTGAILRVHPSNFRIEGFVERASRVELVALARLRNIPLIEDLGSGFMPVGPTGIPALAQEPTVQQTIDAGVDVVCFSGDKLLGGPQAGVIVGRKLLLERIRNHPLLRPLRVDKLTYAALEATLGDHLAGRANAVPALHMASLDTATIEARAERLAARLRQPAWHVRIVDGVSTIGGGSAPGSGIPTRLLALARDGLNANALDERLRALEPPIVGRIEAGMVVLDLRTVSESEDEEILAALQRV